MAMKQTKKNLIQPRLYIKQWDTVNKYKNNSEEKKLKFTGDHLIRGKQNILNGENERRIFTYGKYVFGRESTSNYGFQ